MVCFLPTQYRNADSIDSLHKHFTEKSFLSRALEKTRMKKNPIEMKGKQPLWIQTQSIPCVHAVSKNEKRFWELLDEVIGDYKNDVIWTCAPSTDQAKFNAAVSRNPKWDDEKSVNWHYININHMDGIEAACVIIFGVPIRTDAFNSSCHQLSRLFSRARNCIILVTEKKVSRLVQFMFSRAGLL